MCYNDLGQDKGDAANGTQKKQISQQRLKLEKTAVEKEAKEDEKDVLQILYGDVAKAAADR